MPTRKPFTPLFQTPADQLCREEQNKLACGLTDSLAEQFRAEEKPDIIGEAEQVAKSHGIYLEFNRAKTGSEKEWMYMIRLSNPGGGPISAEQWLTLDELSEKYCVDPAGVSSVRLTTRQNIQFHWVNKKGVLEIVKTMAEKGLRSLNGCGDNTRNVMGCSLSRYTGLFNANAWAQKAGEYFQLPIEPFITIFAIDPKYIRKPEESFAYGPNLLNRKFKIAFSTYHREQSSGEIVADNCVEALTNDMAVVPLLEDGTIQRFQIFIGGGQGERNGKPSMACLAQPVTVVTEDQLLPALDAAVRVHQEWGDRKNRFWARVKYVIKAKGTAWYREQMENILGVRLSPPVAHVSPGRRCLHFGWTSQSTEGLWTYGAFIENGRISDASPNGRLKTMIRTLVQKYPVELMVTPNQDLLFANIPEQARSDFENDLKFYGYGQRNGRPYCNLRIRSGACVGRDTCRLTYTDSEKFEPELLDELEQRGWGDLKESIGITGCERQCFRPATKTIGLVGSGLNRYQIKIMGNEAAEFQGQPLLSEDGESMYLRSVPREQVADVLHVLFEYYQSQKRDGEDMGTFHHRVGLPAVIDHLKKHPNTRALMEKTFPANCVLNP